MKTIILLSAFCFATVAHATLITFNFDTGAPSPGTSLGATFTFNAGGFSILATADPSGSGNLLYSKNEGGDEDGLGLTSDTSDQEITPGHFVQLNISSITTHDPLTLIFGSTTPPDEWEIYQTNTANSLSGATFVMSGTTEGGTGVMISPTDTYLDITAVSGNILLKSLSFTTTAPEPASLALMGGGLVALGWLRLRRRS